MPSSSDQTAPPYDYLRVKISSPTGVHLEETAHSLTAVNLTGEFDILPGHRNFISLLSPCTVKVDTVKGKLKDLEIAGGLLYVENNVANVFLNII